MKRNHRMELRQNRLASNTKTMGWSLFANWYDSMTDLEVGEAYIQMFFNSYMNVNRKIDYNTYISHLRTTLGLSMANGQVEGLGLGIKMVGMSKSDVQAAADQLASLSNGMTPSTIGDFRQALVGQATATPFTDAIVNNALVKAAASVGDTILSAAESVQGSVNFMTSVNKYLPFVLPAVGGFILYQVYLKPFVLKK